MVKYTDVMLSEIMPPNLLEDKTIADCCKAIDTELTKVSKLCSEVLLISRIDELSEEVIDLLAWQWHVDFYDTSLNIDVKRNLLKKSIDWHRHKGTPYAVEEVAKTVYGSSKVKEWFDYGGEPYKFRLTVGGGIPMIESEINKVTRLVNANKNIRSHLDEIVFRTDVEASIAVGGGIAVHNKFEIMPAAIQDTVVESLNVIVPIVMTHEKVEIFEQVISDSSIDATKYMGGTIYVMDKFIINPNS